MKKLVALITGSSRGIGKSIAIEFAKANVNVVINYKENERSYKINRAYKRYL